MQTQTRSKSAAPLVALAATLALATPAKATDPFEVQAPPERVDIVYDYSPAAGWVAGGDYQRNSFLRDGEEDQVRVVLDAPATLTVEITDPDGCAADVVAELHGWDPTAGLWMKQQVADPGPCARLEVGVGAGDYVLRFFGAGRAPIERYAFAISIRGELGRGDALSAGFGHAERDAFTLTGDDAVDDLLVCTGDGVGGCPGDTVLTITDLDRGLSWFDDDGGVGLCSCLAVPSDGIYHVVVAGYGDASVDPYVITVH